MKELFNVLLAHIKVGIVSFFCNCLSTFCYWNFPRKVKIEVFLHIKSTWITLRKGLIVSPTIEGTLYLFHEFFSLFGQTTTNCCISAYNILHILKISKK